MHEYFDVLCVIIGVQPASWPWPLDFANVMKRRGLACAGFGASSTTSTRSISATPGGLGTSTASIGATRGLCVATDGIDATRGLCVTPGGFRMPTDGIGATPSGLYPTPTGLCPTPGLGSMPYDKQGIVKLFFQLVIKLYFYVCVYMFV